MGPKSAIIDLRPRSAAVCDRNQVAGCSPGAGGHKKKARRVHLGLLYWRTGQPVALIHWPLAAARRVSVGITQAVWAYDGRFSDDKEAPSTSS